jgi:hypothetical protein
MSSLLASPYFGKQTSTEYSLAPTFSNDNSPAERAKFLETLETHKYVQDKLASLVIPNLESLDLCAKQSTKQSAILTDDSATAIAEKKKPTARQLLMKIWKKGMPGMSLFVDVGSNWQKSEFLATYPDTDDKDWRSEARFVATNAPAYLYHYFGDVGLSFFPKYIGNAVKAQGWNEIEDRPVTAGEEALDQVLKPYVKDSKMNAMFDFSKMEASAVKDDIQQQQSGRPQKQGASNSPLGMDKPAANFLASDEHQAAVLVSAEEKEKAHRDAFSLGSSKAQSQYYHTDGRPRQPSNQPEVHWGDDSTHVTGNSANDLGSINSLIDDSPNELVMEDTVEVFADDAASLLTSATQQSIARKKKFQEEFARLKAEHQAEMEAHQKAQQEVQD